MEVCKMRKVLPGVFTVILLTIFAGCQLNETGVSTSGESTDELSSVPTIATVSFYTNDSTLSAATIFKVNGDGSDPVKFKVDIVDNGCDAAVLHVDVKGSAEKAPTSSFDFSLPKQQYSKCFFFNVGGLKANGASGEYTCIFTIKDSVGNISEPFISKITLKNIEEKAADALPSMDLSSVKEIKVQYNEVDASNTEVESNTTNEPLIDKGEYYIFSGDVILYKNDPNHQKLISLIRNGKDGSVQAETAAPDKLAIQKSAKEWWVSAWPGNIVHYYFDSYDRLSDDEKSTVRSQMKILESVCSVKFIEENDNVFVARYRIRKDSTMSALGSSTCGYSIFGGTFNFNENKPGTVLHELCHGLGLMHEHQRPDRDEYITIVEENIVDSDKWCFWILYGAKTYSGYDFSSVMHYGKKAGSKNGLITIKTKNPAYQDDIGNRAYLTDGDKAALRSLYSGGQKYYWKDTAHFCWQPYTATWQRLAFRWDHLWHFCWEWKYKTLWTYPYFDWGSWSWKTGEVKGWVSEYRGWLKDCGLSGWDHPMGYESYWEDYPVQLYGFRWMSDCGQKYWPHQEWVW
jgi:hypothetical protein